MIPFPSLKKKDIEIYIFGGFFCVNISAFKMYGYSKTNWQLFLSICIYFIHFPAFNFKTLNSFDISFALPRKRVSLLLNRLT